MKTEISEVQFKPFTISFTLESEEEMRELYDIVGELKCETGSRHVYDKLGAMLEDFGYQYGQAVTVKNDEIKQAAKVWFDEVDYGDLIDGFIAGAKWRQKVIKFKK